MRSKIVSETIGFDIELARPLAEHSNNELLALLQLGKRYALTLRASAIVEASRKLLLARNRESFARDLAKQR